MSEQYIWLSARGTEIKVPVEIIKISTVISKWIDENVLSAYKQFYMNYEPACVHKFINYLSGYTVVSDPIFENMINEYKVVDPKKEKYDDKIMQLYEIVYKTRKYYNAYAGGIDGIVFELDNKIVTTIFKGKDEEFKIEDLAKKLHENEPTSEYYKITHNRISLFVCNKLKEKYLAEQVRIANEKKELMRKQQEEKERQEDEECYKKYLEDIKTVFSAPCKGKNLVTIRHDIANIQKLGERIEYLNHGQYEMFRNKNFLGDHTVVWNLLNKYYFSLHKFLFDIEYKPYLEHYRKNHSKLWKCLNHNSIGCKKCGTHYNGYRKNICHDQHQCIFHINEDIATELLGTYLGAPGFWLKRYGNRTYYPDFNDSKPYRFIAVYLTYQSIINKKKLGKIYDLNNDSVVVEFSEEEGQYKYYWDNKDNFSSESYVA